MDLTATPGSPLANSYVTVAAASEFLEGRLDTAPWFGTGSTAVAIATREAALVWATSLLDLHVRWYGTPATLTQALAWPMTGQLDHLGRPVPPTLVPTVVQQATATYALELLRETQVVTAGTAPPGVKSQRLGDTQIVYQDVAAPPPPVAHGLPREVQAMLRPYGTMTGALAIPVLRT